MDTLILIAATVALIWKVVDGVKMLVPNLPPLVVQAIAWVLGILVAFLLQASDLATSVAIGTVNLDHVNGWTTVLFGLALGSSSSSTVDIVKAIDNTRTSEPGFSTVAVDRTASTTHNHTA